MTRSARRTVYLFFCLCALGISLLFTTRAAHAVLTTIFESPANNDIVSGVAVVRGWAFDTDEAVEVASVELFIDGVSQGNIACCTTRPDVEDVFPGEGNASDSGYGVTFNWGNLSAGVHTIRVVVTPTAGTPVDSGTRTITVVNAGGFDFLDQFTIDPDLTFPLVDDDGSLDVECIQVRDASSGEMKFILAKFRWQQACQCLVLISADDSEEVQEECGLF